MEVPKVVGSELFVLSRDYQHGVSVVVERVEDISTVEMVRGT